ncbi:uncharacterized protein isoform X1 [Musca autumnalis]|uniref:uncharacterized protein isoform X1 n=1 Tax=Musca autumnalis TaxID=221902 RepID=UPI003CF9EFD1
MDKDKDTKVDWTKESILEMINLWQNYECLYNPKNNLYHNKHSRYKAFNEIAEKLKIFNEAIGPNDVKDQSCSSIEDSAESTQLMEDHLSPAQPSKRPKKENITPLSCDRTNREDAVLEAAVNVLENLTSSKNINDRSKNESFCNFLKEELDSITEESIIDEFKEKITAALFDAKKKQRLLPSDNKTYYEYSYVLDE